MLDVKIPKMDGLEVLRRIKTNKATMSEKFEEAIATLGLYWTLLNKTANA